MPEKDFETVMNELVEASKVIEEALEHSDGEGVELPEDVLEKVVGGINIISASDRLRWNNKA